ncbi:hypothetical protein D0T90_02100 [Neisseria animalis]|uniref:DUF5672 domain-containing protein n=2 Tax=Neisseria animalis TaxID=492 RepID=A0A5P3MPM7_NEIAN|nr:hypothetical protein D0T90_02100 [Neisseria animalis]
MGGYFPIIMPSVNSDLDCTPCLPCLKPCRRPDFLDWIAMSFSNLTVVAVTGSDAYTEGSAYAVARSCRELPGARGLLVSPSRPRAFDEAELSALPLAHYACRPFGYLEYNYFMLYLLADLIETDYCLVVQNDGWVLDGKNWRDEFWQYDYLGAPIPKLGRLQNGVWEIGWSDKWFECVTKQLPMDGYELQNGGFSLRSRRLLEAPRRYGLFVPPEMPQPVRPPHSGGRQEDIKIAVAFSTAANEDVLLSGLWRQGLEEQGFRFAPLGVADWFAYESTITPPLRNVPFEDILGVHSMGRWLLEGLDTVRFVGVDEEHFHNVLLADPHAKLWINAALQQGLHLFFD